MIKDFKLFKDHEVLETLNIEKSINEIINNIK